MKKPITRENIAQAAKAGEGIAYLTPGQCWACWRLNLAEDKLPQGKPIGMLAQTLASMEKGAQVAFRQAAGQGSTEELTRLAYDDRHPAFLRRAMVRELDRHLS